MRRSLVLGAAALLAGALGSVASVTVQTWYHFGDPGNPQDSSGNSRHFLSSYSHVPPNNPAFGGSFSGIITPTGIGGPLGTSGYTSTSCTRAGYNSTRICTTWGTGYNPPLTNFFIEISMLPTGKGYMGGSTWLFTSGENSGSYAIRVKDNGDGTSSFVGSILGYGDIGSPAPVNTNRWIHLAMVNDNGVTTFYTNGVACGPSDTGHATSPSSGSMYIGTRDAWQGPDGLLDEARICTFAPGQFSTGDFLMKPAGPVIVSQPQNSTVWSSGAVTFGVAAVIDPGLSYQWRRNGTAVSGGTGSSIFLPTVTSADSGAVFTCVVSSGGLSVTSSPATLTVVSANAANVAAYRSAINGEASLTSFFPVDGSTSTTLANTKDPGNAGLLEFTTTYDGRTNRSFGERALSFDGNGVVQVPGKADYEFASGNGTIEALVFLNNTTTEDATIAALAYDGATLAYALRASKDGGSLVYSNDYGQLSWSVNPNLAGRFAHVALVIQNRTNVTAYVDGNSLGTKQQIDLGFGSGAPLWIGCYGRDLNPGYRWVGTIDELAIYTTALSQATVQTHYSKYFYGTNTAAPSIVSQPSSKTLMAGGTPTLAVQAAGTLPLSYQWKSNGVSIPGATAAQWTLPTTTPASSATYSLSVQNAFGSTNTQPIVLTFTAPPAGYATAVMNSHPVSFWRLGEASGATAVDSAGFNDAAYTGSMTCGVPGAVTTDPNTAVQFTGGNAPVGYTPVLNPATAFTVEAWVKPTSGGQVQRAIAGSQNRNVGRSGYALYQGFNGNFWEAHIGDQVTVNMFLQGTSPVVAGEWYHVVLTYDANDTAANGRLYVNGVQEASGSGGFLPNNAQPFTIAGRQGLGNYLAVLDDLVFYNYALTPAQITNHWSYIWSAAAVTVHPTGVTTSEWSTVTLTANASGTPNTYQWQKDGVNLSPTTNPDGTAHYPSGVTGKSLVISQAHPADGGQYRLVVINPVGGATSTAATVTITPDTTKPTITKVTAMGTPNTYGGPTPFLVRIDFSERLDATSATTPGNYTFSAGTAVSPIAPVQVSADGMKVYVPTTGLTPGAKYTVTVSGVKDQAQSPNTIATATKNVWTPTLAQGMLWDFYNNVANGVANLTANQYYPNAPYTNLATLTFNSGEITGGDLNNVPTFGPLGDNYGCSLSGWITPTVSANYYFYLASDDAAELQMNTAGADPALAATIAVETGCCHGFQEPGNPTTSYAIPLVAGQSYFIRALQTEGGGGDYVRVAWKMESDPTASTNLVPISASVLKAYVPLPAPKFSGITRSGSSVVISWTGAGTLLESADLKVWAPVSGSPTSPYTVTPAGPQKFYRVEQ